MAHDLDCCPRCGTLTDAGKGVGADDAARFMRHLVELSEGWTVRIDDESVTISNARSRHVYARSRYENLACTLAAAHAGDPPL